MYSRTPEAEELQMHDEPKRARDRLDHLLKACDPVARTGTTESLERALDELGAAIASRSRHAPQTARRRSITRRTALLAAAAVVISGGVATGAVLSARTGQFQPTQQEIATASSDDAARMRSELSMGGPGEFLNPAAPDFRDVALQIASDIPYPEGYESWRDFLISDEIRSADGEATESSGALHGWFAASAFCAWVHTWRQAEIAGDTGAAAQAAQVISPAPGWKAVTDEDPHPDPSVPADQGSTYTLFGWMLPYRDAVIAGDRDRVEHLLSTGYGDKCSTSDPDWRARLAEHREWGLLSRGELARKYEQFLASARS
jgi:hypothetical protein